ncbi:MAG: sigma factor G inhibitor Gin [Clostridia bacterium]|jgi:hypothetical protein
MTNTVDCIICKKKTVKKICILGKNICEECEKDIVSCDVTDKRYEDYKEAIKEILFVSQET